MTDELAIIEAEIVHQGYIVNQRMIELVTDRMIGEKLNGNKKQKIVVMAEYFNVSNDLMRAVVEAVLRNPPARLRKVAKYITYQGDKYYV